MAIHPVIRIVTLLVLAAFIVWGGWSQLILGASLALIGFIVIPHLNLRHAFSLLRRLRWLFISILLVYLWFTPGIPLFGIESDWMPSEQGVVSGLHRVICLAVLMLSVALLLQATPLDRLTGALLWLLHPFSLIGLNHERIAVRIALTMEAVKEMDGWYHSRLEPKEQFRERVKQWGVVLIDLFEHVTAHASAIPERVIEIAEADSPAWYQWLIPVGLGGVLFVI